MSWPTVYPFFSQHIGEDGVFRPGQPTQDGTKLMLDELHKWAGALKTLRPEQVEEAARQNKAA